VRKPDSGVRRADLPRLTRGGACPSDAFRSACVAPSRLFVEFAPTCDGLIALSETIDWMAREGRRRPILRQVALWLKSDGLRFGGGIITIIGSRIGAGLLRVDHGMATVGSSCWL
jgi:hypothetical protein